MPPIGFDTPHEMPGLSQEELATKRQALRVLQMYFMGEMEYGGAPAVPHMPDDDEPKDPVPQPA